MQKILNRIVLILIALSVAYATSWCFGVLLSYLIFGTHTGEIEALYILFGVGISYVFWLSMMGGFLRTRLDYVLMVFFLLPALWWEMQLDASRIYVPIALGVVGFVIGYFLRSGAEKVLKRPIRI